MMMVTISNKRLNPIRHALRPKKNLEETTRARGRPCQILERIQKTKSTDQYYMETSPNQPKIKSRCLLLAIFSRRNFLIFRQNLHQKKVSWSGFVSYIMLPLNLFSSNVLCLLCYISSRLYNILYQLFFLI